MQETRKQLLSVYRKLSLGPGKRSTVAVELASDVVHMQNELVNRGIAFRDAERISLETLVPDEASTGEMEKLHGGFLASLSRGKAVSLLVLLGLAATFSIIRTAQGSIASDAGVLFWITGGVVLMNTILFLFTAWRVFVRKSLSRRAMDGAGSLSAGLLFSLPFLVSAVQLLSTDPLESVFWLHGTAALLCTGFTGGILILLMHGAIELGRSELLCVEENFIKTLDELLEDLR